MSGLVLPLKPLNGITFEKLPPVTFLLPHKKIQAVHVFQV